MKRLLLIFAVTVFCLGFSSCSGLSAAGPEEDDERIVFVWAHLHFEGAAEAESFVPAWDAQCKAIAGPYAHLKILHVIVMIEGSPVRGTTGTCLIKDKAA